MKNGKPDNYKIVIADHVKELWSIQEIAAYCDVTPANIGHHIKKRHIKLFNEHPMLINYEENLIIIESIRIKKSGY